MFRFEYNFVLYALLIIPILIGFYIFLQYRKRKNLASFGELRLIKLLMSDFSPKMQHLKFTLLMLALTLLIFAIANPQTGSSLEKGKRKGVDIMLCVDVSNSMLAEDMKPNRMEAAKMGISRFIDQLKGDRIGVVVFAGNAFVQLPITSDYAAAKMFVNHINTGLINEQGTDIAAALDLAAVSMLPDDPANLDKNRLSSLTSKVILLISDGEDHFQEAIDVTQKIRELGITVHTIGIGSPRGEPIPIKTRKGIQEFKKDKEGNTVITRLNEAMLRDIAAAGNGVYVHASNTNLGFEKIKEKIDTMHKADLEEVTFAKYDSQFQIPLFLALILLFIEMLLFTTHSKLKNWLLEKHQSFKMKSILLILFFLTSSYFVQAQTKEELSAIRKGNREFFKAEEARKNAMELQQDKREINQQQAPNKFKEALEEYTKAEINYRKAMTQTPDYDKANYNLGTALYRQEKYDEASSYFAKIAENEKSRNVCVQNHIIIWEIV
jgi:Ca-activated chloride channel family protein